MATTLIELTTTWAEIGAFAFIGQRQVNGKGTIEITSSDTLPVGEVPCHKIMPDVSLSFPAPASGSWYARVDARSSSLVYTEV
ncbi:MAG: hypothetical protein DRG27_03535 [Deltaproteobacteria bacterium]|nr:MAG: hypothetical protein DRG27_03535 [Deltaproteobacteria bacterium]